VQILGAALAAAEPAKLVRRRLERRGESLRIGRVVHRLGAGRVVVLAVGKAARAMAAAAEQSLGRRLDEGLAICSADGPALRRTRVLVAGHPIPDARGLRAAEEAFALLGRLRREDLLLVLLSGGASALLPAPVERVSLEDKAAVTQDLLRAGATIHELNAVRKHLSRAKGGGLARAAGAARIATLALSDVVGDELSTIGSGPTVPDPTRYDDAVAVLRARSCWERAPASVRSHLEAGRRGDVPETPKPGDPIFARASVEIVGSNALSLEASARAARRLGFRTLVLTTRLEGEAREAGRVLLSLLRECVERGRPARPPVCLLASGETTVSVRGDGHGGRNQELVAACIEPLAGFPVPALVASLATDGIDGRSDAAGGLADDTSLARARALSLAPPAAFLAASDSSALLASLQDLIVTGPTGTNVLDLSVLLA
jgi:hydroxypyruvate reductase